jgi:hypothetical protein
VRDAQREALARQLHAQTLDAQLVDDVFRWHDAAVEMLHHTYGQTILALLAENEIAAAKYTRLTQKFVAAAVQAEREGCANQAWACSEMHHIPMRRCCGPMIAESIRARGPMAVKGEA